MVEPREWLIRKDGYFYRPNCAGYTTSKFEAGRYTKAEAEREAAVEPWHMKAIHQDDVEDDPVSSRVRMDGETIASLKARISELERALAERAGGVRVKGLEWVRHPKVNAYRATTMLGTYQVWSGALGPEWLFDGLDGERIGEAVRDQLHAKSAAQADYESRILSALTTDPAAPEGRQGNEPRAYIVHAPEYDYYGTGPDRLQFHPLAQHDMDNGYRQTPLYGRPAHELSGNTGELIDKMAEAIRGDTTSDDTPWATLSEDRKIGWRGDAERALAVVKEYLTARRPSEQAVTEAARVVLEWYERDGSVGGAVEPFEALKAAMEAGG